MFCIPQKVNRELKKLLENDKMSQKKLIEMSSEEREALFEKYMGKPYSKELNDRFIRKFNTNLSKEEFKDISEKLAKINEEKATNPILTEAQWKQQGATKWARDYVDLMSEIDNKINPTNELNLGQTIKTSIKGGIDKIKNQDTKLQGAVEIAKVPFKIVGSPIYKSLKAAVDASFALRQGFKVFTKSPKTWWKYIGKSFEIFKNIKSQKQMNAVMNEFKAIMLSHPNYEALVQDGKLAIGVVEEFFPTAVVDKIPALGNIFKASNESFTIFSQGARFDIANELYKKQLLKVGRELTKDELKAIGQISNSITGRGSLGKLEPMSKYLNDLFFSARYVKSAIDTFTMPFSKKLTPFARQEALKHSVTTLGAIGAIMATASIFTEVNTDPFSSKFGKAKLPGKDNWVDLTAGLGSYITLVARQATGNYTTASGYNRKLNTGEYGSPTRASVAGDFVSNKLSPFAGTVYNVIGKGQMFDGEEPTYLGVARNLIAPITADNFIDYLQNEDTATALLLLGLEGLGANVRTPY